MTDAIYLKEILLSNFRSFGPEARITLPPGPGVTVVAGPNGLGKTSLIEGIEWALTGQVRRLLNGGRDAEAVNAALTRNGAVPGSHAVGLLFVNDARIDRGPGAMPSPEEVIALLQSKGWSENIADVSAYLAMTHILSQSAMLRLTARPAEERWSDLSQPAGMERMDRILRNLGKGTKDRLQRRANALEAERMEIEQRLSGFISLRESLEEQEAAVAGLTVLPPAVVLEAVRQHCGAHPELGPVDTLPEDAGGALSALLLRIAAVRRSVDERRQRLDAASAAADGIAGIDRAMQVLLHELSDAIDAGTRAEAARAAAADAADAAERESADCAGALDRAVAHRDRLYACRDALAQHGAADARCRAAEAAVAALREERGVLQEAEDRLKSAVQEASRLGETSAALRRELGALDDLTVSECAARDRLAVAAEARRKFEETASREGALHEAVLSARADLEAVMRASAAAEQTRAAAAAAFDLTARLAAEIVAHLHEDDTVCPVCTSRFEPGDLLRSARSMVERHDPRLAEATRQAQECADLVSSHSTRLAGLERDLDEVSRAVVELRRIIAEADEMTEHLLSQPLVSGRPLEGLADWLGERIAACRAELDRTVETARRIDPDGRLSQEAAVAFAALRNCEERLEQAGAAHRKAEDELNAARARIDASRDTAEMDMPELQDAIAAAQAECARVEGLLAAARQKVAGSAATLQEARRVERAQEEMRAGLLRRRQAMEEHRSRLIADWSAMGLPEYPSPGSLENLRDELNHVEGLLASVSQRHEALADGYRQWLESERLQPLRAEVQLAISKEGATDAADFEARLKARAEALARQRDTWQTARTLANAIEQKVRNNQQSVVKTILQPLQARVEAFDRVWSSFPNLQLDVAFGFTPYKKNPRVEFLHGEHDAGLILSEGQGGVKSLSYLLSASTAYRWSRWPALLLDDPLQHNDLIHKTAFLDVLRALVAHEGYQVIMSTHDLDEARFIGRKCRNAGIAFRLCRLIAPGSQGVIYDEGLSATSVRAGQGG